MNRQDLLNSQLDEELAMRLDNPTASTGRAGRPATALRASSIAALLLCLVAVPAMAQAPTVNGLFHGDGDVNRYSPYATSAGGSVLYSYYDAPTQRMYVALVVGHAVNDMVCSPQNNSAYTQSSGWPNHRSCKRAADSEFATFTFQCAPGSPNSWTWQQGLGCAQNAANPPSNWVSDATCTTSSAAALWPPSIVSSSSWVRNINTYQAAAPATRAWNLYALGNTWDDWKSPFLPAPNNNNVTLVPGYPTYSTVNGSGLTYAWEWSMVYEWSVNLGPGGTNCGDNLIVFIAGNSHHSPGKSGSENDPFDPPANPVFSDWGDLPSSYNTLSANNGPRHQIRVSGPYLGTNIQAETDGTPTSDATGDGDEEDGVTVNVTSNWTPGSTQSITVVVGNAPSGALLGGWIDWNRDGTFGAGEFYQWSVVQGTNNLSLTIPAGSTFNWAVHNLYARFRLVSDGSRAPGGSLDSGDFVGLATNGEIEDYVYPPGALPVTLNAFSTEGAPGGPMTVRWQTASETENVAFEIHGLVDGEWRSLSDLVETRRGSSALPQSYEVEIDAPLGLTLLQLADYDTHGRTERFGSFQVETGYGEVQPERRVDWSGPRAERSERLRERGFADTADAADTARGSAPDLVPEGGNAHRAKAATPAGAARWKRLAGDEPVHGLATKGHGAAAFELDTARGREAVQTGPSTHVAVTEAGIQRITYEALRDGGLDLAGVQPGSIAVTFRGEPVPRWVSANGKFGPGDVLEFLGRPPAGDDALYIDTNLYQVAVDASLARDAGTLGQGKAKSVSAAYRKDVSSDRPLLYHPQSPTGDPWVERSVLARSGGQTVVTLDLPVTGPVLAGTSHLSIGLGSVTDLQDVRDAAGRVIPEHEVSVWLRSADGSLHHVTDSSASGQRDWRISAPLPDGWIQPGLNRLELRFSTDYFFSLVVVDSYGVTHPAEYRGPSLDFAPDRFASGYLIGGFSGPGAVAYAEGADGSLTKVATRVSAGSTGSGGGYSVELRSLDAARFWVTETPHAPAVFTTAAPPDLLSQPGDLVVIAGSSFVGTPALDDYVAQRAAFGPVVIDVEDVYNAFGHGMATPSAITDFLAARDAVRPFTHVQLVGTDCYDRLSYVSQCLSFVPLPTAPVGVNLYTPSQNRLVDLDGDGVGDKAVGQFSVRNEAELATIVRKAAAWESSGLSAGGSALLIAEETDGLHDFAAQIDRIRGRLGWSDSQILKMADHPSVLTARDEVRSSLGAGRSVTVFSGHSSPSVWAFRALLTTAEVATLTNDGRPTIMVPLACETTYDISPSANVLGHQLLYAGDHGALAISGAVALSSLAENELMADHVLQGLRDGLTLGQAVLEGRKALGPSLQQLQDNWITQGDVAAGLIP